MYIYIKRLNSIYTLVCGRVSVCLTKIILLFSIFLLLFMDPIALFSIIHGSYCIISANFLPFSTVLSAKNFSFSKISEF